MGKALGLAAIAWVWLAGAAAAQDKAGCADHPAVSRFAGSTLLACKTLPFEEAAFPPAQLSSQAAANQAAALKVGGRLTALAYHAPAGKTAAEVIANYKQALSQAGFAIRAEHAGRNGAILQVMQASPARPNIEAERYLLARKETAEGALYVSVGVGLDQSVRSRIGVDLRILEEQAVETGQVVVDAAALQRGIQEAGKIALYGIYFETGKATLTAQSAPQLGEIAKLLKATPGLSVYVVGHTDNQGALALNQDLSKRRAEAVAAALASEHGIAPARLAPAGVGPLAPVASNATEAGRARNRRTEIVAH